MLLLDILYVEADDGFSILFMAWSPEKMLELEAGSVNNSNKAYISIGCKEAET